MPHKPRSLKALILCRFGGPKFSYSRMSWIKTNFLWMMYRCGWATKPGQERVLAVRITREGFNHILTMALTGQDEKEKGLKQKSQVRLQWDPDHTPSGAPHKRRAIQLGLRDEVSEAVSQINGSPSQKNTTQPCYI